MSVAPVAHTPVAGWYPDPSEPSVLRYWDGGQWTHHLQPAAPAIEAASNPSWLTNRTAIGAVVGLLVLATIGSVVFGGSDSDSGGAAASSDADAMAHARAAQAAIEAYSTDHDGQYAGATPADLAALEPTLRAEILTVEALPDGYVVTVQSGSGVAYSITRDPMGSVTYSCSPAGEGDCPDSGDWSAG